MMTLKTALMNKFGFSELEAESEIEIAIDEMQEMIDEGEEELAYQICCDKWDIDEKFIVFLLRRR